MRLTPEQVAEKLAQHTGTYDDGDIPGMLSMDPHGGLLDLTATVYWEPDGGEIQLFQVKITEVQS